MGLGNMGNPMTKNLLKAGFEVVVFNRNRDKEKLIELGATSAASTQELMQTCDVVITMLSNDEAVKEVYERERFTVSRQSWKTDYQYEYSFS
jgi:3-hydroxyisobutyrate dehydrogenase